MRRAAIEALDRCLDSAMYRALAEPARLQILKIFLLHGPIDIAGVVANIDLDRSVVSRHLKVLHEARLVTYDKQGRNRIYSVCGHDAIHRFEAMTESIRQAIQACCPEQLTGGCCDPSVCEDE
jgi:DNA-binding transcriptional ArsR family regulator